MLLIYYGKFSCIEIKHVVVVIVGGSNSGRRCIVVVVVVNYLLCRFSTRSILKRIHLFLEVRKATAKKNCGINFFNRNFNS
jgi:hypothetical protein